MKFDMSEAWREAMAMVTGNREVLLIVAGIFFLLPSLVLALSIGELQQMMFADPEAAQAQLYELYAGWWWLLIAVLLVEVVGYLALLALLRDSTRPTVGEALRTGLAGLLPAIGAYLLLVLGLSLVFGLLVGGAMASGSGAAAALAGIVAFVAFVYICVKVSLAGPVIAIDKVFNPVTVLTRSWRLTKGNSFRLFLFYLLLFIVYIVIAAVIGAVVGALTLVLGPAAALTANGIVSGILSAAITVVFVAVVAAVHRQLSGPSAEAVSQTFE
jgi:membrane-anchored glycerophosphoryl diester phosphodiesterase (GDPDase)